MSRTGRTLTKHFQIETRQHDLFNLDLGEGIPRRMLVSAVVLTLAWCALLWWLIGAPTSQTSTFYLLPPTLVAYFGFQENSRQPRRRNLAQWAVSARYLLVGHRPIVRLGARGAYRSELLPLSVRLRPMYLAAARLLPQARDLIAQDEGTEADRAGHLQAGRPIDLGHTATLYGFDHMQVLRQEKR